MKDLSKKRAWILLAFLLFAGMAATSWTRVNARIRTIVAPSQTPEFAVAGIPVSKNFTLPVSGSEVRLYIKADAPVAFTMMLFDSEGIELDSVRVSKTDSGWERADGSYRNGYFDVFDAGAYHATITFEADTAFRFTAVADEPVPELTEKTLAVTEGFSVGLSVINSAGTVKWKSSKPSVASVSSKGKVTAKKTGKCTVTAMAGGKRLKCAVTVQSNKYSAAKLTNRDIPIGKASWEAYSAFYDEAGNLTIKCRMVNNCGNYSEYLRNLSVKVKTATGMVAANYKEQKKELYVEDLGHADFKIVIPKSDLKIKKQIDLRNASIVTAGKFGYTYYGS